jgi:hypothetical protein
MIGIKFGRLTVLEQVPQEKYDYKRYVCECQCGNRKTVRMDALKSGRTKSCGCYQSEMASEKNSTNFLERALDSILSSYKGGAKSKKLEFSLNKAEFRNIISQDCHYCGTEPRLVDWNRFSAVRKYKPSDLQDIYANGIDRKDNSIGYTSENTVPCCPDCNYAKRGKTYEYFLAYLSRITRFMGTDKKAQEYAKK